MGVREIGQKLPQMGQINPKSLMRVTFGIVSIRRSVSHCVCSHVRLCPPCVTSVRLFSPRLLGDIT